jgi:hypothetical protein
MIDTRKFFGISMARRQNRRMLLLGGCAVLLTLFASIPLARSLPTGLRHEIDRWEVFLWIVPGLILFLNAHWTGLRGFVRNFGGRQSAHPDQSVKTLFTTTDADRPVVPDTLDERDIRMRNAAHYAAYQIVIWLFLVNLVVYVPVHSGIVSVFLPNLNLETLIFLALYLQVLVSFSLPQAILLWTEPDMEEPQ